MTPAPPATRKPKNPYVGPRAFRAGEPLYGRSAETRELADLLIAERIVLLHAPSGAGKTSLIQASLTPLLDTEGFAATPPLRVKTPAPGDVHNRYVYSVALDMLSGRRGPSNLEDLGFDAVIDAAMRDGADKFPVIVLDQLEEILLLDPTDIANQTVFFQELGEALATRPIWALLSMREDYMGGLDRFVGYLPGHLTTTYRLDFLEMSAAKLAIQEPARAREVMFAEKAASALVRQLATVKVQLPGEGESEVEAPYVQPVQLQVVCRELWRSVRKEKGDAFTEIELDDVEQYADIPAALRSYYADVVQSAAEETGAEEHAIRSWFGTALITPHGFRSQTSTGPTSRDVAPAAVLRFLQDAYLIRSDTRAGTTWYELAHDKLIGPILDDNATWERSHLAPWQLAALAWRDSREEARLLTQAELRDAPRRVDSAELRPYEREFLEASQRAERERGVISRARGRVRYLGVVAVVEFLIIVLLLILLARSG